MPSPSDVSEFTLARKDQFRPLTPDSFRPAPGMGGIEVRDIAFGQLSADKVAAQVFRATDGWSGDGSPLHMHDLTFQLGYVISGSITYDMEGLGVVKIEAGCAIYHIPRNRFRIIDRSNDFEGIWFKVPATDVVTVFSPTAIAGEYDRSEVVQHIK